MCKNIRKSSKPLLQGSISIIQYVIGETNCICLSGCSLQAFLELNSEECAQTMVSYYSSVTPVIRNHPIYMQYSTHKELKTDNSPNQVVRGLSSHLLGFHIDSFINTYKPSPSMFRNFLVKKCILPFSVLRQLCRQSMPCMEVEWQACPFLQMQVALREQLPKVLCSE